MSRSKTLDLTVESLAAGGDGVGRAPDGRAVFVPFTAPGDRVRVGVVAERGRFLRGEVAELLAPGPARSDPLCPVFGSCGGCAWQHLDYAAQLAAKLGILEDALRRIGHLEPPQPVAVHASPSPYGYRCRARVLVRGGRVGFRRRRSHAPCPVRRCPILLPALDAPLAALADRPPARDGDWQLCAGSDGEVDVSPLPAAGPGRIRVDVGGDRIEVSSGGFVQANALLRGALAEAVWDAAGSGEVGLELFAGAGFFSLGLARRFGRFLAVESEPRAAADLRRNLGAAGIGSAEVMTQPVEDALAGPLLRDLRPDAVVLDPPRTGLPPGAGRALAALAAERIVYVSCDPATLARDLGLLADAGHGLRSLALFDLFPQTPHVEALALLTRG